MKLYQNKPKNDYLLRHLHSFVYLAQNSLKLKKIVVLSEAGGDFLTSSQTREWWRPLLRNYASQTAALTSRYAEELLSQSI